MAFTSLFVPKYSWQFNIESRLDEIERHACAHCFLHENILKTRDHTINRLNDELERSKSDNNSLSRTIDMMKLNDKRFKTQNDEHCIAIASLKAERAAILLQKSDYMAQHQIDNDVLMATIDKLKLDLIDTPNFVIVN
jgi:predicted RNase H-like nuclease (RuvC/YqgF family)